MDDNYDVVEMDFPPYEEEYSHLPEPESTAEPFYKVKEEVYRRNRAIAAEEQTALLKAEERRKAEKRERYREMLEEAKPVKRRGLIGKEKLIPWIIVVVGIVSSLHWVDNSKPDTDGVYVTSAQPAAVSQAATAVREPFEEDGSSYIYNTDTMSYKFTGKYYYHEDKYRDDGKIVYNCVHLDVTVKNLTNYPYMVMSEFYFCADDGVFKNKGLIDSYNPNNAFSSGEADSEPEAFSFDENNLCNFSIDFAYREGYHTDFSYLPKRVSEQFVQYAAEGFQIPIEKIMAILETDDYDELKLGIVREPFENDGVSYIYCTSAMSYRFTPSYEEHDGEPCLHINVDVKNLTDYDYIIVPNFTIKKEYIYIPKVNGEYVYQPDGLLVYEFDENSLCSFLLEFDYYNVESDGAVLDFSTQSFKTTDKAEKCDENFEIPIKSIMAILETEAVTTEEKTAKATTVKSETDAYEEMLKATVVREPFEEDGSSYIYNTDTMSYKFTGKYYYQEYKYRDDGKKVYNCVHLDVTVKNLTDYPYMVMSEFYFCTDDGVVFRKKGLIDSYNPNNAFSSGGADSEPEAFSFDENNLCNFSIDFGYREGYWVDLYYLPERVSEQFVQYAAEDFMIPIEDIMNFLT